jgi:hypothetical protein
VYSSFKTVPLPKSDVCVQWVCRMLACLLWRMNLLAFLWEMFWSFFQLRILERNFFSVVNYMFPVFNIVGPNIRDASYIYFLAQIHPLHSQMSDIYPLHECNLSSVFIQRMLWSKRKFWCSCLIYASALTGYIWAWCIFLCVQLYSVYTKVNLGQSWPF